MNNKFKGLTNKEVLKSRETCGMNIKEEIKKDSFIIKVLKIFLEPMFLLLLIAASVYFIVGEVNDGIIMLFSILIICIIEFFQEQRTDKALEELNKLSALNVTVIREGKELTIDSKEIVVGDIVVLGEGDKVPVDGVILSCEAFGIDESMLTGESDIIYKMVKEDNKNHFKKNWCYEGTIVTSGTGYIKVVNIGKNTELGKIGKKISDIKQESSPLEKQVNKLVFVCTIISFILFILTIAVNFVNNSNLAIKNRIVESIISGITVAISTIPEEIPVVLTVFLCLGSLALSKKKTLTKNNKTIETLSCMTVLCTDKTGTLTENKMKVSQVYDYSSDTLLSAFLACEKEAYDPMEMAIKKYHDKHSKKAIKKGKLVYEYIFNSESKMVGKIYEKADEKELYVKGAYENVLKLCVIDDDNLKIIKDKIDEYSKEGLRVIAVAKNSNVNAMYTDIEDYKLEFCGLIALKDPARKGVKESIQKCKKAGIRVIMITGDSGKTALGIAKNLDLTVNEEFITGKELEKMTDKELREKVKTVNIFARVYPEHKMRIVNALQKNGEVVGMTGDGINDAPALKRADIGIAMGLRGTNVSKEAADIILLDDNFNTIVSAVENGRCIYNNIRKSICYILAIHMPIALLAISIGLLGYKNLLFPVHIVLLELLIDPTSSILFQRVKPDKNIMEKLPRLKDESIISKKNLIKSILQGLLIFITVLVTYIYLIDNKYPFAYASTISFSVLLMSVLLISFNLKDNKPTLINVVESFKDKVSIIVNGIILSVLLAFIYMPISHNIFNTCALNIKDWLIIIGLTFIAVLPFDILKIKKS